MLEEKYLMSVAKQACEIAERNELFTNGAHDMIMIVSEVVELEKALQERRHANKEEYLENISDDISDNMKMSWFRYYIKDTIEDEFADIVLRILSFNLHYDFMLFRFFSYDELFEKAPYKTKPISVILHEVIYDIVNQDLMEALALTITLAKREGIDLEWHINEKMKYNDKRVW